MILSDRCIPCDERWPADRPLRIENEVLLVGRQLGKLGVRAASRQLLAYQPVA